MFVVGVVVRDEALGHNEELRKVHVGHGLEGLFRALVSGAQDNGGLKGLADALGAAGGLQHTVDVVAQGDEGVPLRHLFVGEGVVGEGLVHAVEQDVARVVPGAVRHGLPDLVAGEGEDRGEHLGHGVEDQEQGGLGAAALQAVALLAVEAVLDDVEVEARKLHHAEVVDRVGDGVELIVVVGLRDLLDQLVELGDGPAVEGQHVRRGRPGCRRRSPRGCRGSSGRCCGT